MLPHFTVTMTKQPATPVTVHVCVWKKIHQTWSAAMLPSGIVTPQNQFVDLSLSISPALTFIHPCIHREINTLAQLRTSTDVDLYPRLTHLLHLDLISSGQLLAVHDDVELLVCQVEPALVTVGLLLPDGDPRGVVDVHTWNGMKRSWELNLWLLCEVMIVTSVSVTVTRLLRSLLVVERMRRKWSDDRWS